jgi:hypothetical protein
MDANSVVVLEHLQQWMLLCGPPCNGSLGWGSLVESTRSPVKIDSLGGSLEHSQIILIDCNLFLIGYIVDWSRWFAISSLPPICSPNFSFMGEVGKQLVTQNLDVRNIFEGSHTERWWRCS